MFPDFSGQSFAQVLDWTMKAGIRPEYRPGQPIAPWSNVELSGQVGAGERTVRNWRAGRNVPDEIGSLIRVICGGNPAFASVAEALKVSFEASRRREGPRPPTPPPAEPTTALRHPHNLPFASLGDLFKGRDAAMAALRTGNCWPAARRPSASLRRCMAWAASARRAWRWNTPTPIAPIMPPGCSSSAIRPRR
jgi:hypothetical protein